MKVFVYWNLHRKCWSIKSLAGTFKGKVFAHARELDLANVVFKVSEAGRQRVLREGKKNVHAGAVGTLEKWTDLTGTRRGLGTISQMDQTYGKRIDPKSVRYNPRTGSTFTTAEGQPINRAEVVHMLPERLVFAYGT